MYPFLHSSCATLEPIAYHLGGLQRIVQVVGVGVLELSCLGELPTPSGR